MTPVNRWKLISALLAGCMAYSWWHGDAPSYTPAHAMRSRFDERGGARVPMVGVSSDEVVRRLFSAKNTDDVRELAQRLGVVGNDAAIDAVRPLLADPRAGVPEAIVGAFGAIATEHAVDVLIEVATDPRDAIRTAAIEALGVTRNRRGEPAIVEVAQRVGDAAQSAAIHALGELGTERAVGVLAAIASHPGDVASTAVRALARIELPSARAAIAALVDSPSIAVAASAIGVLTELDEDMIAKLGSIVQAGDRELVLAALSTLARAGDKALPTLRAAALEGALEVRITAMRLLVDIDHPLVLETLASILDNEDGRAADAAASVIASIDSDAAREVLISAALAEQGPDSRAVEYLMRQTGPEVEQALLVIATSDSRSRWDALEHLVRAGNTEALAFAVGAARSGSDESRIEAMEALASAASQASIDALVELARGAGELKPRALEMLGEARPDDPVVARLLHDSVQSSDADEAAAAAAALSRVGTPQARDALIAALGNRDPSVARNAAMSLSKFRITDEVTAALRAATVAHPELSSLVMHQLLAAGSPHGLELAKRALADGESHDAARAISALEQAGTPAAFDALAQGARASTDPQVRAEAISSIGVMGDKRSGEVVAQALRDSDANVRSTAARALGQIATPKARELLIGMTRSADAEDRQAAVSSLRRFDDADSTRRLGELVRDPSYNVSYAAMDAIADRPEALPALRGYMTDGSVAYDQRRQAAQVLSYRGISDPLIDQLLGYE
jgi:HEAT repeat protein